MKKAFTVLCLLLLVFSLAGCGSDTTESVAESVSVREDSSILIAYFTRAGNIEAGGKVDASTGASINLSDGKYVGNTELLARWIQDGVGGDLWPIRTAEPYAADYDLTVERGKQEKDDNARPQLTGSIENMKGYDVVFLGFPDWWYDMPMAVYTFLEEYDLSGKTVIPFCTSGGSGFSDTLKTIKEIQSDIKLAEGLEVRDKDALGAETHVKQWLRELGFSGEKERAGESEMKITVMADGRQFDGSLQDNETTQALRELLPLTMDMTELHGNEKYYNLAGSLPVNEEHINTIYAGDLMLFGSDCLVLFYEDFETSYSYTRLGRIDDTEGLSDTLGRGTAKVTLGMAQ